MKNNWAVRPDIKQAIARCDTIRQQDNQVFDLSLM